MSKNCENCGKPIAAIWWRQSTKDQSASNDTQVNEARAMLEAEGYCVKYILGQEWHSLSILDAPKMQELLSLVRHTKIKAIGMYHGDRLAGNPAQKAIILDLCEKHGVKLLRAHLGQGAERFTYPTGLQGWVEGQGYDQGTASERKSSLRLQVRVQA